MNIARSYLAVPVLAAALCLSSDSQAQSLGVANFFNAFVFENASANGGHADGAVAVGGNFTGSGYEVVQRSASKGVIGANSNIGMYVGGSVNFSNNAKLENGTNGYVKTSLQVQNGVNLNGGGKFFVGTTYTGPANSGILVNQPNPVDSTVFSNQKTFSLLQSNLIAGLSGTAINTSDPNNWSFNVGSIMGTQKVLTIQSSALNNLRTLDITGIGANDTVLINVLGSAPVTAFGVTVNTNTGNFGRLLWNFKDVTQLDINQRAFHGSILAPLAAVSNSQNIDGNLIARSWSTLNSAEIHMGGNNEHRFSGVAPVPEPGTMIALGAGLVAFLRRRKKA